MTEREAIERIQNDLKLHHDDLSGQYRKALRFAISALEKQEQDRWHSVAKEGNPKEEGLYIITKKLRNRNGMEMYKVAVDRWSQDGLGKEWSYNSNVFVSAWRPLPEPYTEEEA